MFFVSRGGIPWTHRREQHDTASEEKIKAVLGFPESENARQVQFFLRLERLLPKIYPDYSTVARPLSNLLKMVQGFSSVQLREMLLSD